MVTSTTTRQQPLDVDSAALPSMTERKGKPAPHMPNNNNGTNRKADYRGGITWRVIMAALVAANAGLVGEGPHRLSRGGKPYPAPPALQQPTPLAL